MTFGWFLYYYICGLVIVLCLGSRLERVPEIPLISPMWRLINSGMAWALSEPFNRVAARVKRNVQTRLG